MCWAYFFAQHMRNPDSFLTYLLNNSFISTFNEENNIFLSFLQAFQELCNRMDSYRILFSQDTSFIRRDGGDVSYSARSVSFLVPLSRSPW